MTSPSAPRPTATRPPEAPDDARRQQVALLDLDAEFVGAVPEADRPRARRALVAPVVVLGAGPVHLTTEALPEATFALLVARGVLRNDVSLAGRELSEMLVPGDVVLPWPPAPEGVPATRELTARGPVALVALDGRFLRAAAAWPALMLEVHRRLSDQEHRIATHGVICQLPRVEQRILAVLWHLAARTGKVGADGTVVPVRMTHKELGRLVGAQRPTVTLAVKQLSAEGRLVRRPDGTWLLPREGDGALAELGGSAAAEPELAPAAA